MIKILLLHPAVITRPTFFKLNRISIVYTLFKKYINIVEYSRGKGGMEGRVYIINTVATWHQYIMTVQKLCYSTIIGIKCKSTHVLMNTVDVWYRTGLFFIKDQ